MESHTIWILPLVLTICDLIIQGFAIYILHKIAFCPLYVTIFIHRKLPKLSYKLANFISYSALVAIVMFPIIFLALEGIFYLLQLNYNDHIWKFVANCFNKILIYLIALFIDYYYSYHYSSLLAKILAIVFFVLQWSYQVIAVEIFHNYLFQNWVLYTNYFLSISRLGILLHFTFRNNIFISNVYDKLYNELTDRFIKRNLSSIHSDSEEEEEKKNGDNPLVLKKEDSNECNENLFDRLQRMNIRRDIPLESGERHHDMEKKEELSEFPSQVISSFSNEISEEPLNSPDNESKDLIEYIIKEMNNSKNKSWNIHLLCNISFIIFIHIISFIVHK